MEKGRGRVSQKQQAKLGSSKTSCESRAAKESKGKKNSFKPKVKTKRQGKAKQVVGSTKELQKQRTDGRTPDKKRSLNRGREGGRDGRERREDDNDDEDEDEGDAERSNQDDDEHEQDERERETEQGARPFITFTHLLFSLFTFHHSLKNFDYYFYVLLRSG